MAVNLAKGDTRMAKLPETVSTLALNGHQMLYRVTRMSPGVLQFSEWDAAHDDDNCTCVTRVDAEPLAAYTF